MSEKEEARIILAKAMMDALKPKKMDEDIILVCNGKERKGMSTTAMCLSQYVENEI